MKKLYSLILFSLFSFAGFSQDLIITGVLDGDLSGGLPKAIEIYVINDVADLSTYGIGSANNGGGTDGVEFQFSGSATAGQYLYVSSEDVQFPNYFGISPDFVDSAANVNGDDAIELFGSVTDDGAGNLSGTVIDVFGDIDVDGNGEAWEYMDGWAYRIDGTGPEGSTFTVTNWTYSGPGGLDGETTNASAANPWPIGTYSTEGSTEPTLTVTSPGDGDVLEPFTTSVDIVFGTMNVDFATAGNQVNVTVNGNLNADVTSPFNTAVNEGANTILVELLVEGSVVASETLNITVAVPTDVADIAALRAVSDDAYYRLTGEALVTFTTSFRNQKYFEDASGAILIDDTAEVLGVYNIGDGITNLIGQVTEFGGTIQFVPFADPGASSTDNAVTSQEITLETLSANPEEYESELVTVIGVTFDDNTGVFETSQEYATSDATGSFTFRATFGGADYIGEEIPDGSLNITAIVTERFGSYYYTSRDTADLGVSLSVDGFASETLSMYPNPVQGERVHFNKAVDYVLFDIQGRVVTRAKEATSIEVEKLNTGVYLVQINSGLTKKLIVR